MKKSIKLIIILLILGIIGFALYWFYFIKNNNSKNIDNSGISDNSGFKPLNNNSTIKTPKTVSNATTTEIENNDNKAVFTMPKLRRLSDAPIAGMYASTSKIKLNNSTTTQERTVVRYTDRGTGHVYESNNLDLNIEKISNTTLPKIYEAYWNNNLNKNILRYLKDNTDTIVNFYSELKSIPNSAASSTTAFETKGKYLSSEIKEIAVSPKNDKVFTYNIESGKGIGYVSEFDEKGKIKIFETPLTQVNIDWPELNTLTIITKGSTYSSGYLYSINTKTSEIKKLISNIKGLSAKMSSDGKQIVYSSNENGLNTYLLNTQTNKTTEILFKTLADKCVWSKLRKEELYCAVPFEIKDSDYPDVWYRGSVSFVDQIWALNTNTGEVYLLANLLGLSNKLIDATKLTLDPSENYLYFVNKNDLNLWSLDLNQ